jgi:quercetin dioxygenase-like cupin family protein
MTTVMTILMTLLVSSALLITGTAGVSAQEVTPAPGAQAGPPEGVTTRMVASGSLEVLAPGTAFLNFGRFTLAPGAVLLLNPMDPSAALVYPTSGELTFRVEAPMTIARRGALGTPVPPEPEAVDANTEFTLRAGDSALFPPLIAGEVRNDGSEPASAWVVNFAVFTDAASTPTP